MLIDKSLAALIRGPGSWSLFLFDAPAARRGLASLWDLSGDEHRTQMNLWKAKKFLASVGRSPSKLATHWITSLLPRTGEWLVNCDQYQWASSYAWRQ